MTKVNFFYCTGTSYTFSMLETGFKQGINSIFYLGDLALNPNTAPKTTYVAGLNGAVFPWDGNVQNDPFPFMLNTNVWNPVRVAYSASSFTAFTNGQLLGGMGLSIDDGVGRVIEQINSMPPGQPFAIGGYSQGAAVMSQIYNEIRSGSLTSRQSSFLGGVMYGNPRRQTNHRGEIGGTWSGAWDVVGSTTGGHGSFPASGPYARLSGCDPTEWIEFTAPNDVISSTGDSTLGTLWTQGNDVLLELAASEYFGKLLSQGLASLIGISGDILSAINSAFNVANSLAYIADAVNGLAKIAGAGHVTYPSLPPPSNAGIIPSTNVTGPDGVSYQKAVGNTCYQLALSWLESKALEYVRAPILLPSTGSVGWSTTLVPPGS